jgi:putative transposase
VPSILRVSGFLPLTDFRGLAAPAISDTRALVLLGTEALVFTSPMGTPMRHSNFYRDSYPAAISCLLTGRDSLTVYLRFPREHWNRIRHSNFIERTFGETRRRVKVIGCLPGEHSCLSLVWAVLDRASAGWRGFTMAPAGLRLLQDLRRQLTAPPARLRSDGTSGEGEAMPENVTAVA